MDLCALGKADFSGKDLEQLLASRGFSGVKVEEKKHNRGDFKTFKLSLVDKQQAWSVLSLEGAVRPAHQTTASFKVASVEVPVASKVYSDYGDDCSDDEGEEEDSEEGEGDSESGDSREGRSPEEARNAQDEPRAAQGAK